MSYVWMSIIIALAAGIATGLLLFNWLKSKRFIFSLTILTSTFLAFIIAVYIITPYYKVNSFAQQLKTQSVFAILATQDPVIFNAFLTAARPFILKQKTPTELAFAAAHLEQRIFIKMLKKAPDAAITPYLKATLTLYNKLLTIDPKLVLQYEYPQKFNQINFFTIDSTPFQQEYEQYNSAKAAIIISTLHDPQKATDRFEVEHLIDFIRAKLDSKYGERNVQLTFTQPTSVELNPAVGAQIIVGYYQELTKISPIDAGKIIRFTK